MVLRLFSIALRKIENIHAVKNRPKIFTRFTLRISVGVMDRVKDFFDEPPDHNLKVGDLVTCTCHGGIAVILELYDEPREPEAPLMNMARIWWIKKSNADVSRDWMHTIHRLKKC